MKFEENDIDVPHHITKTSLGN